MADLIYMAKSKWRELLDTIRTKGGTSASMTADQAIAAVEAIPSGGGGMQLIANGTFTGAGVHTVDIPVGTKMPQTDFMFAVWVDDGTTITPAASTDRVVTTLQFLARKRFCYYNLSSNGTKLLISRLTYPTVGSDGTTITNRTPATICNGAGYVRMMTAASEAQGISSIVRASTGFTIKLSKNSQYPFANGITYNWEIIYVGSDPTNDIVEVA